MLLHRVYVQGLRRSDCFGMRMSSFQPDLAVPSMPKPVPSSSTSPLPPFFLTSKPFRRLRQCSLCASLSLARPTGPSRARLTLAMEQDVATPLPGILAVSREAGCLDEPAEQFKPNKRQRPNGPLLKPVPMRMCPRHPSSILVPIRVQKKTSPNYGRTFCE